MKDHTKTIQSLKSSKEEANEINHKRTKDLERMKAENERTKVLIEKVKFP